MGGQNCTSAVDLYSFGVVLWVRRSLSAGNPGSATHGPASLPGVSQQQLRNHMAEFQYLVALKGERTREGHDSGRN